MHAVCMCSVKVMESDTNKSSWIRVKEQQGAESAGGLKVKALSQTLRDAGSSPAWYSKLFLL